MEYRKVETPKEMVGRIIRAYENVDQLCWSPELGCTYEHVNGVGCAISCVIPPNTSKLIDRLTGYSSITEAMSNPEVEGMVRRYIDEGVPTTFLQELQYIHDESVIIGGVDNFKSVMMQYYKSM